MNQQTLDRPVSFSGYGLWTGKPATVRLVPAPPDSGVVFKKERVTVRASIENCFLCYRGLGIKNGAVTVLSVEHLLAALYSLAIDNVRVEIEGPEIPFGDGSALPFVRLLTGAGTVTQDRKKNYYELRKPLLFANGKSVFILLPSASLQIGFFYSGYLRNGRKRQRRWLWVNIEKDSFLRRIAPARTFGQFQERKRLEGILPFALSSERGFLYPEAFRSADELVCHKALDLLGSLALLGRTLRAKIIALGSGHSEHLKLVRFLKSRSE